MTLFLSVYLGFESNIGLFVDWELRLEQATGLAFRFVIGRSKDEKKMAELEKEIKEHRDFVLLDDVEEEYLRLPYKT